MLGTRSVSVFLLLLCSIEATAQQASHGDLNDFVGRALETNKGLAAARARIAEARGMLRQAGARPTPDLEVSGSSGRPFGSRGEEEYSASYSYQIETAGKRSKRVEVAETGVGLAEAETAEETRQLTFRLASKFIDALASQQELDALDRLIAIQREFLRLVEARVKEGDAAPLERQLISVDVGQIQAQRAISSGRFESALRELRALAGLTGTEPGPLSEPPPLEPELTLAELQQRALRDRAELKLVRAGVKQAEAEITLSEAQGLPDITLLGSYSREYGGFDGLSGVDASGGLVRLKDRDDKVTVGIQVPLGTKSRNAGNVEAARARAAGASLRYEYAETAALLEVEATWQRVQSAHQAVELFDQGILKQSEQNVEIIRQAYELGQLRLMDVLNEQRRAIEVRLAYIGAKTELQRAIAELEFAVGGNLR